MSKVNQVTRMYEIARGLEPTRLPKPTPVESGQYGDFEIKSHGPVSIFTPISDAAIRWTSDKIPLDWVPRHNVRGFILDTDEMDAVVAAAERDGLISCEAYQEAMNELDALSHQWELT